MKTITINNLEFELPTSYQDLNKKGFLRVCQLLATNTPMEQLQTLYFFLGLKWWSFKQRKKTKVIRLLDANWVHTLMVDKTFLGWIFDLPVFKQYFIKSFWHKGRFYVGPPKDILNLTALEIVYAYQYFKDYSKNPNEIYLNYLMAILYRPLNLFWWLKIGKYGYNGDKRIEQSTYLFDKRVVLFKSLPMHLKMGIFLQFSSAWAMMENKPAFKYVFDKQQADENAKEDPHVWEKIMMQMGKSGVFGPYNEVQKMDKDRFFMNMQANIEEYLAVKDKK